MKQWPVAARLQLQELTDELRAIGLLDLIEDTVSKVWSDNVARYDPQKFGDTPLSIGVLSTENLRRRLTRICRDPNGPWVERRVQARASDNSLVLSAVGVEVRFKKVRQVQLAEPAWRSFDWTKDSSCRREAAARNTGRFSSLRASWEQLDLLDSDADEAPVPLAQKLQDVFVVWSGSVTSGHTAAWVGYPCFPPTPWLAVQRLWWHRDDPQLPPPRNDSEPSSSVLPALPGLPAPQLRLRPMPQGD